MLDSGMLEAGRPRKGRNRVLRGGSWLNERRNLRSANRNANPPDNRNRNIGLRLAGALWAGGSINQRSVPFRLGGQNQGPRRGSRPFAEPLPVGRSYLVFCHSPPVGAPVAGARDVA